VSLEPLVYTLSTAAALQRVILQRLILRRVPKSLNLPHLPIPAQAARPTLQSPPLPAPSLAPAKPSAAQTHRDSGADAGAAVE